MISIFYTILSSKFPLWCGPYYIKKNLNFILSFFNSFYPVKSIKHGVAQAFPAIPLPVLPSLPTLKARSSASIHQYVMNIIKKIQMSNTLSRMILGPLATQIEAFDFFDGVDNGCR